MYIATYETGGGDGFVKKFTSRAKANKWLKQMHFAYTHLNADEFEEDFKEWKSYGAFSAKVWKV